jgi:hypothetical protein
MLLFGSIAAAVAAAGAVAAWWWLRKRLALANSIGLAALTLWAGAVAVKLYVDHAEEKTERLVPTAGSIAWPLREPLPLSPSTAGAGAPVQAAPVESLIGGLAARLAAAPEDSAGWALLAQSYAFVSNSEAAETAVQRAVALGVDETTLRARVQSAQRRAPPVDWVEETLRATRERRLRAAAESR